METFLYLWTYYVVALSGMFGHFLKKNVKGESITEIKDYFKSHFKSTLLAFSATTIGFLGLVTTGEVTYLMCATLGFSFDSLFNKWDSKKE